MSEQMGRRFGATPGLATFISVDFIYNSAMQKTTSGDCSQFILQFQGMRYIQMMDT
jgi:hypothetical protein